MWTAGALGWWKHGGFSCSAGGRRRSSGVISLDCSDAQCEMAAPAQALAASSASSSLSSAPRRGLVVAQAPPRAAEQLPKGYLPLQGMPERRLVKLAGLSSPEELWAHFDRLDLLGWCPGPKDRKDIHDQTIYGKHNCDGHRFPLELARIAAGRLVNFGNLDRDYAVVVLCGRHVANAFGLTGGGEKRRRVPWTEERGGVRYLVMPHPSGVSHFWNDPPSRVRAAQFFRTVALEALGLETAAVPVAGDWEGLEAAKRAKSRKRGRRLLNRTKSVLIPTGGLLKRRAPAGQPVLQELPAP